MSRNKTSGRIGGSYFKRVVDLVEIRPKHPKGAPTDVKAPREGYSKLTGITLESFHTMEF